MLKLEFDRENAAFEGDALEPETARILRGIADKIENGSEGGKILDGNGNTVGQFKTFTPDREALDEDGR